MFYFSNRRETNIKLDHDNLGMIDTSKPITFLLHGWKGNSNLEWIADLRSALLKRSDNNIIAVDYRYIAGLPSYLFALMLSPIAGK